MMIEQCDMRNIKGKLLYYDMEYHSPSSQAFSFFPYNNKSL